MLMILATTSAGAAQSALKTWRIDTTRSRAWYLIEPHYGHLYGSTCRFDYDEGARHLKGSVAAPGLHSGGDPRKGLHPAGTGHPCARAIVGEITAADPQSWAGLRGMIIVTLDSLTGPSGMRDHHLKTQILHTEKQPFAKFVLDSLITLTPGADTTRAVVAGTMELNGMTKSVLAPVRLWWQQDGSLRVDAQVGMHPRGLVTDYKFSRTWIGLGWYMWNSMSFGVDLLLRAEPAPSKAGQ
jgi:polyisoprenoid-binding protein YceI